ncbi:MAG TPA: tetratricopeptide repeat protein [Burkholderiaceae bacterium]|nr:tetratricopeptide repeat protein [Burkholderiaceae bacterium]
MRFVETFKPHLVALALPAALVAALSGCASLPDPVAVVKQVTGSAEARPVDAAVPAQSTGATPAERAAAAEKGGGAAAAAPKNAEPEVPVDPRAQTAFDTARRAMRAGRNDDAVVQLKALAQSNPELGGVHANLGLLYRQAGKLPESATALEKAVQASPRQAVFHNQLAITYRLQGQFTKARDEYEQAIALDAGYAAPVLNLGILNDLYLQDRKRALALYDQYLAMSGGDAAVTKWVADLKNRKDDHVALNVKERP